LLDGFRPRKVFIKYTKIDYFVNFGGFGGFNYHFMENLKLTETENLNEVQLFLKHNLFCNLSMVVLR